MAMAIEEAISHARETSKRDTVCEECRQEHAQLADWLEELKMLRTAITPPNEWVNVKERLPQLRENVLVCAYWHEHWGVYIGWNNGHGWTVSCGIGQRNDVQVSHWMLLPAPPDRRPPEGEA